MALAIQLAPHREQTDFNLACWEEILADPDLAKLEQRIETDRHGNIMMSPRPGNPHSFKQSDIYYFLRQLLPDGKAQVEVPISTSDGVRAADVTWTSNERFPEIYDERAYRAAPDICVEVISPRNSAREMADKKALYFDAGAREVWLCQLDGSLEFFGADDHELKLLHSKICPDFPGHIDTPRRSMMSIAKRLVIIWALGTGAAHAGMTSIVLTDLAEARIEVISCRGVASGGRCGF